MNEILRRSMFKIELANPFLMVMMHIGLFNNSFKNNSKKHKKTGTF